jgi:hypothetical protein
MLHKNMNMDDSDNFPFDKDGKLLTRSQYVSTMIRVYGTVFSTTMDLQTEDVTSYANERYDQLQAEQPKRAANVVADFVQTDHATGEQPTAEDQQRQWVSTQIINLLQMDRLTNPRLHSYVASAVIQEIDTSQTGNPEDIATALIAQADARYDARQATAPAAATSDSDTTTGDLSQAEANATEQLTEDNKQERARLQRAQTAQAHNAPAHFPVTCKCPDCETEVAMQRLELEDRVMAEVIQEGEDAFIAQQAASTTAASTVVNAAPSHDAVPQAGVTTSLRERANDEILRRNEAIRASLRLNRYQAQDRLPVVTAEGTSGDLLAAYRSQLQQEVMTVDIASLYAADNPNIPCTCPDCAPSLNEADNQDITQLRRGGLNRPEPVRCYIYCPCPDCADCADDM